MPDSVPWTLEAVLGLWPPLAPVRNETVRKQRCYLRGNQVLMIMIHSPFDCIIRD